MIKYYYYWVSQITKEFNEESTKRNNTLGVKQGSKTITLYLEPTLISIKSATWSGIKLWSDDAEISRGSRRIMGSESWALSWLGLGLGQQMVSLSESAVSCSYEHRSDTEPHTQFTEGTKQTADKLLTAHSEDTFTLKTCLVPGRPQKYCLFISRFHLSDL